jgi:hypothetical protein
MPEQHFFEYRAVCKKKSTNLVESETLQGRCVLD